MTKHLGLLNTSTALLALFALGLQAYAEGEGEPLGNAKCKMQNGQCKMARNGGEGERTREPLVAQAEPKRYGGGLGTALVADLAFYRIAPGVAVAVVNEDGSTQPLPESGILPNLTKALIGDTELRLDGPDASWNGRPEPPSQQIVGLGGVTGIKQGSFVEILDETPLQYFERRPDGAFDLKTVDETPGIRAAVKVKALGQAQIWVGRYLVTRREPIEGVTLDVGEPVLAGSCGTPRKGGFSPQSIYTITDFRYSTGAWEGFLLPINCLPAVFPFPDDYWGKEGYLLTLVRLRESSGPQGLPGGPPPQYTVETQFIHVPHGLDKNVLEQLQDLPGAVHRHGTARAFAGVTKSRDGFIITLKNLCPVDLGAIPDAELLSAPRLTTLAYTPERRKARREDQNIVIRQPQNISAREKLAEYEAGRVTPFGRPDFDGDGTPDMPMDASIADFSNLLVTYVDSRKLGLFPEEKAYAEISLGLRVGLGLTPTDDPSQVTVDLLCRRTFLKDSLPKRLEGIEAAKAALDELLVYQEFAYQFAATDGEWVGFAYDAAPEEGLTFVLCGITGPVEGDSVAPVAHMPGEAGGPQTLIRVEEDRTDGGLETSAPDSQ
jgi:hypothetical protein